MKEYDVKVMETEKVVTLRANDCESASSAALAYIGAFMDKLGTGPLTNQETEIVAERELDGIVTAIVIERDKEPRIVKTSLENKALWRYLKGNPKVYTDLAWYPGMAVIVNSNDSRSRYACHCKFGTTEDWEPVEVSETCLVVGFTSQRQYTSLTGKQIRQIMDDFCLPENGISNVKKFSLPPGCYFFEMYTKG